METIVKCPCGNKLMLSKGKKKWVKVKKMAKPVEEETDEDAEETDDSDSDSEKTLF